MSAVQAADVEDVPADTDVDQTATEQFMEVVDQAARKTEDDEHKLALYAWVCLHRDKFPRKQCIAIVSHRFFDYTVLSLIFANCLTMMIINEPVLQHMIETTDDYAVRSTWAAGDRNVDNFKSMPGCHVNDPGPCSIGEWVDFTFLILFAIEMILKATAFGLMMHKKAYLCSGWNWLDFIVVVIGFVDMFSSGLPGISTLRLVRTLRPLRSLQRIRGMRVLVQCILEAMPQMCTVLVFLVFIIVFFALFGVAFFKGGLRHSCHYQESDGSWTSIGDICNPGCEWDDNTVRLVGTCSSIGAGTKQMQTYGDPAHMSYSCRPGFQCRCSSDGSDDPSCSIYGNPNFAITSFDSLPWAMISLFQAISLEGWVDIMYAVQDGRSVWVWTYFIALVLFGAIIVINLFLAVLCDNFEMADRDGPEKVKEEEGQVLLEKELRTLKYSNKFRQAALNLVKHKYFDWFVQGCIVTNTTLMILKYAPTPMEPRFISIDLTTWNSDYLPEGYFMFIFVSNFTLTIIFTFESMLKIFAFGGRLFCKDKMNVFDLVVVFFSLVEIIVDILSRWSGVEIAFPLPLSVLRAFRIFRLFKLVRSVPSIRKILVTLIQSMGSVIYLAMLLILIIIIFMLLGMELFGGFYPRPELNYTQEHFPNAWTEYKIQWEGDPSRYHFDDLGNAFLAIFVVLSGENWNEIMFHSHEATWIHDTNAEFPLPWAITYFIALFVIGNLLLFNLFIAILLSNFDDDEEVDEDEEDDEALDENTKAVENVATTGARVMKKMETMMTWQFNGYALDGQTPGKETSTRKSSGAAGAEEAAEDEEAKAPLFPTDPADFGKDRSMFLFSWSNPARIFCAKLVSHWLFETVILCLICISTILMLMDRPDLRKEHPLKQTIGVFNYIFAALFTIEMIFKWITHGIFFSKTPKKFELAPAYFTNPWNVLDGLIVVISLISLADLKEIAPLRAMRALRPLRLVSRYEDLKITVATLFKSVPAMVSLMWVAMLFFIIFAILGLELFGGKLGYCMDPEYGDEPYGSRVIPGMNGRMTDYEECMLLPRYNLTRYTTDGILLTDMADMTGERRWLDYTEFPQWLNPQFGNFDNLATSLLLLFEISALEGWPDVMHVAMDSDADVLFVVPWRVGKDADNGLGGVGTPMEDHTPQAFMAAVFFILWIILGCFVVVNMTVGVVVDTFSQIKAENDGLLLMSEDAADWVRAQKQVFAQRPLRQAEPPQSAWRLNVYYVVTSTKFEIAIMIVIVANMLQMGCDWWEPAYIEGGPNAGTPNFPQISQLKTAMNAINYVFFAIYVFEMCVKWIGLGFVAYFKNSWDCFDFFLVMVSTVEVIVGAMGGERAPFPPTIVRVLRLFRVIRILRVIKAAKKMRTIIMTVVISLPQLKNIMMLIFLIIIMVDVLCVSLFFAVNYTPGNFLDDNDSWNASVARGGITLRGEVLPTKDAWYYSGQGFDTDGTNWGDMINRHANFQYIWTGMLVLVRSATGESFNGIMHDLYDANWGHNKLTCCPECGPMMDMKGETVFNSRTGETIVRSVIPESSCGSTGAAFTIYFIFQMVMAYIVLSIMIGVILENFANVGSETRKIRMDDLEEFREVWLKYDPKGTWILPSHNLLAILQQLKRPLGIAGSTPALTRAEMLKHLGLLDIPDHGGYIHFMETLTACANHHAGVPVPLCDTTKKMQKQAAKVPHLSRLGQPTHSALTNYLVSLLQSRWRGYAMRSKYDNEGGEAGAQPPFEAAPQKAKSNQVMPEPAPAQ